MNVIILAVDSLRADHLGCYGYARPTSPHIDALAGESLLFERAFAAGIPTMPSFTTLLTGVHPYRHGITAHSSEQRLDEQFVLLPQLARAAGAVTIGIDNLAVQGNGRGSWFARGFDFYSGFLYKPFSDQSAQLADRALRFLEDYREKPFLLYLHLWDPHSPYGPPPPYDTLHDDGSTPHGAPPLEKVKSLAPEYYESFLADMKLKRPDDYNHIVAQYDGEISYCDAQIGRILQRLKELELWDETIVVLLSDHGECFGEGGVYFDHHGLYDAVLRVALLCRVPGGKTGRSAAMVTNEDILPTLAELAGWPLPEYSLTGRSFAPALCGEPFVGREFMVGIESTRQASICLRTEKWKLILPITHTTGGARIPDIYGRSRAPEVLLFDLEHDSAEKNNLSAARPDVRDTLLRRLGEWRAAEVARRGDDPLQEYGLSLPYDDFMARLNARNLRG